MECLKAEVVIEGEMNFLEAVKKSLHPDNESPPKGYVITEELVGNQLRIVLKGLCKPSPKEIITVMSTIDEIVRLAESIRELVNSYKPCE